MAVLLLKYLPKSSLLRHRNLSKQISQNNSSAPAEAAPKLTPRHNPTQNHQQTVVPQQSNAGLTLAVGISLGLGVATIAQSSLLKKFFPDEEKVHAPVLPQSDPVITQELLNVTRRMGQMENLISHLSNELREKDQLISQHLQKQAPTTNNNVFELSKVIEANDLASANRHRRELEEQHKALNRDYMVRLDGEITKVENKYRPMVNTIRQLEAELEAQEAISRSEEPARILWLTCQSLLEKLRFSPNEPLEKSADYELLKKLATANNPLAIKVLDTLPPKALKEGVCSEETLIDRFSRLETVCKRVAMVDESGAGLGKYLVSYLQSLFILENVKPTQDELSGKTLVDPTSWNTYDILGRVRWCLKDHNIEQAIRYANQLRGQARVVARDWIRDARIHLETKQAIRILASYARSISLKASRENVVNDTKDEPAY